MICNPRHLSRRLKFFLSLMSGTENTDNNIRNFFPQLNLPPAQMKLRREKDCIKVFDILREKYVVLTPEEFVRQNFVTWLISGKHYPKSLIANEIGIDLNGTKKRCDTVVFNPDGTPLMIVEYKAPEIGITQSVFDQIARYNMCLRAKYLAVSNGINHYCCVIDYKTGTYNFLPSIPDYNDMKIISRIYK